VIEFVTYIIKSLVEHPDVVQVTESTQEDGIRIVVSVNPADAGLVIGKRGYVIRAIRQLTNILANRQNARVYVDVVPLEA